MASPEISSDTGRYFQSRKLAVEQGLYTKQPYTSSEPHSCVHCQKLVIDIGSDRRITRLRYEISKVVAAAEDGCELFQLFIDLAVKSKLNDDFSERGGLVISASYEKEQLPYALAMVLFSVYSQLDGDDNGRFLAAHRLLIWAKGDDPVPNDILARPYVFDYRSAEAVSFARDCMMDCQMNHEECRGGVSEEIDGHVRETIDPNSLPFRLLELYIKDSMLYLRLIGQDASNPLDKTLVSCRGYAILSYCWGGAQPVQLTKSSVDLLSAGMVVSSLPKTIRDAAWFTHSMGLEYLWVDALCILQDDLQSKEQEISRMALYYGQSTVTICAASSAKYSEGFLHTRLEDPADYTIGPIQLQVLTSSGLTGSVQLFDYKDYFNTWRPPEPTTLRAWTLQETLLSRRILIFSTHHFYFTCKVANASCGGQEPVLNPRIMPAYESRIPGVHTFAGFERYPIREAWRIIVEEYTRRHLGFAADKLPAVSALATSLVDLANQRHQRQIYLAGLMLEDTDPEQYSWRTQLLWAVTQMQTTCKIPGRAPSWSWSALDGPIMGWGWRQPRNWTGSDGIHLIQYHVDLENQTLPFGTVKGGLLRIRARVRALEKIPGIELGFITTREHTNKRVDSEGIILVLSPDTREAEETVNQAIRGRCCVLLLELIPFYPNDLSPIGLIITNEENEKDEDKYTRIGIFEFQRPEQSESEAESHVRQTLFDGLPFRDISIT